MIQDVPVPIWRVCFPFPKVAFKPLDLLYMDLMAVAGVLAILAQVAKLPPQRLFADLAGPLGCARGRADPPSDSHPIATCCR